MNNVSGADSQSSPEVFYDVAMKRLDAQMDRIEAVDRKVSSIIGFASVIIAVFTAALKLGGPGGLSLYAIVLLGLAGAVYIALIFFSVRAYKFMKWDFRPNLETLHDYCTKYGDSTMRYWVARDCILSYKENEGKLSSKTSDARIAMYLLSAETTLLVLAVFLVLVHSA